MALAEVLACGVCIEQYGESDDRRPRSLQCGHTLCTSCVRAVGGKCPHCRCVFSAAACPVNFSLLDVLTASHRQGTKQNGRQLVLEAIVREAAQTRLLIKQQARTNSRPTNSRPNLCNWQMLYIIMIVYAVGICCLHFIDFFAKSTQLL